MVIPNADDRNLSCGQGPMTGIMKEMDFRILGPLQVRHSGGELDISRPFVRRAICLLTLFGVDSPLPPGQMRQMLWETGGECGRSGSLKTLIWQVRQVLTPERLVTERGGRGYRLVLDPADSVDVADFRSLTEDAEQARARGNYAKAAGIYGQALGIWREPALDDLPETPRTAGVRAGLLGEFSRARETSIRLQLDLGRHREVLAELRGWVAQEPLEENLHRHLMVALYRSGLKAEALAAYDSARSALRRAGIEPGRELQRLRARIIDDEDDGAPRAASGIPRRAMPPPRQLPPALTDFTDRDEELRSVVAGLRQAQATASVPVVHLHGSPGIGKTALATVAAHRVSAAFPDGQLFVSLSDGSRAPRDPNAVLAELLRALDVPAEAVPGSVDERAALFRSLLAGKRVLVVADDADDGAQVRPLLPGVPGSGVIVTSRRQDLRLDGAHRVELRPLSPRMSTTLLRRIVGEHRVDAEPDAARRICDACAGVPLAIRAAGARLVSRPAWALAHLARLDALSYQGAVRTAIASGYEALPPDLRRALRHLAVVGPNAFPSWAASLILGEPDAESLVEALRDRSLLSDAGTDPHGRPRYVVPDLIRQYATRLLGEDPHRDGTLKRFLTALTELADVAAARLPGAPPVAPPPRIGTTQQITGRIADDVVAEDPSGWFETERELLIGAAAAGVRHGAVREAHRLAARLDIHLSRHHLDDAEQMWRGFAGVADAGIRLRTRFRLAVLQATSRGQCAQAIPALDDCIGRFAALDHRRELAWALAVRAQCARRTGDLRSGAYYSSYGLKLATAEHDQHAEIHLRRNLALLLSTHGRHREALSECDKAMRVARRLGQTPPIVLVTYTKSEVFFESARYDNVVLLCRRGMTLSRRNRSPRAYAYFEELLLAADNALRGRP